MPRSIRPPSLVPTAELNDVIRAPFESLFGHRTISMINGPVFYISAADYNECMKQVGVRKRITVEAEPLLLGGYTVARLTGIEYFETTPFVFDVDRTPVILPPTSTRRDRDRELSRQVIVTPK